MRAAPAGRAPSVSRAGWKEENKKGATGDRTRVPGLEARCILHYAIAPWVEDHRNMQKLPIRILWLADGSNSATRALCAAAWVCSRPGSGPASPGAAEGKEERGGVPLSCRMLGIRNPRLGQGACRALCSCSVGGARQAASGAAQRARGRGWGLAAGLLAGSTVRAPAEPRRPGKSRPQADITPSPRRRRPPSLGRAPSPARARPLRSRTPATPSVRQLPCSAAQER